VAPRLYMVSSTQFPNRKSHCPCLMRGSLHVSSIACHGISRQQSPLLRVKPWLVQVHGIGQCSSIGHYPGQG